MKSAAFGLFVSCLLFLSFTSPASAAPTAGSKASDATIQSQAKLDLIIKNEQEILLQLEDIKKELVIIKMRATR